MMQQTEQAIIYASVAAAAINDDLARLIVELPEQAFIKRSHYFNGRYENCYVDTSIHPGLGIILAEALSKAAEILQRPETELRAGFWLNIMHKGDITTLHSHDDDDELLSAVYYVQVPQGAGLFKLHIKSEVQTIKPVAGSFMFFDPALAHEVTEHRNDMPRLSIGINIGPRQEI